MRTHVLHMTRQKGGTKNRCSQNFILTGEILCTKWEPYYKYIARFSNGMHSSSVHCSAANAYLPARQSLVLVGPCRSHHFFHLYSRSPNSARRHPYWLCSPNCRPAPSCSPFPSGCRIWRLFVLLFVSASTSRHFTPKWAISSTSSWNPYFSSSFVVVVSLFTAHHLK